MAHKTDRWLLGLAFASNLAGCGLARTDVGQGAGTLYWEGDMATARVGESQTFHLHLERADGSPWADRKVSVTSGPGIELGTKTMTTAADGSLSGTWRCLIPGPGVLLATAPTDGTVAAPIASLAVQCLEKSSPVVNFVELQALAAADGADPVPFTLVVTGPDGQPLTFASVQLAAGRQGDTVTPTMAISDGFGRVSGTLSSNALGTGTIVAQAGDTQTSASIRFVAGPPSAAASDVTVRGPPAVADGSAASRIDVHVRDDAGRDVPYAAVHIASDGDKDSLQPVSGRTDAFGIWSTGLTSRTAGARLITATLSTGVLSSPVHLVAGPPSLAHSALTANPNVQTVSATQTTMLTAVFQDTWGNPVVGQAVTWNELGLQGSYLSRESKTSAAGVATATVISIFAGTAKPQATAGGVTVATELRFVAGPPDASSSRLVIAPNGVVADASSRVTLSAEIRDAYANLVSGAAISLASSPQVVIAEPMGMTSAQGVHRTTATSTRAGSIGVTANVMGPVPFTLEQNYVFLAGAANIALSRVTGGGTCVADGQAQLPIEVRWVDRFLNPIAAAPISLTSDGAQVTFSPPSGQTNAEGIFVSGLSSPVAQALHIFVAAQGANFSLAGNLIAGAPSSTRSILTASPNAALASDGISASTLRILVRDGAGNALPALPVRFSLAGLAGQLSQAFTTTSNLGEGVSGLVSRNAGLVRVVASVGDIALTTGSTFAARMPTHPERIHLGSAPSISNTPPMRFVRAMDVNGDGIEDIVSLEFNVAAAYTYLGLGQGDFAAPVVSALTDVPGNLFVSDFNHDGRADVAVAYSGSESCAEVYFGAADGSLLSRGPLCSLGPYTGYLCGGDINGDGLDDVVVTESLSYAVYINAGDGTFLSYGPYSPAIIDHYPFACALFDFDGDGLADLAKYNVAYGSLDIAWSQGQAPYFGAIDTAVPAQPSNIDLLEAGLLGDPPVPSLIYQDQTGLTVRPIGDARTIGPGWTRPTASASTSFLVRDMNADGTEDILAIADSVPQLFLGKADGTLAEPKRFGVPGAIIGVEGRDIDADGRPDFLYLQFSGVTGISLGRDGGLFDEDTGPFGGSAGYNMYLSALAAADFDQDGHIDLFGASHLQSPAVFYNDGAGHFPSGTVLADGVPSVSPATGDFDGDGRADGVVANMSGATLSVFMNQGQQAFTAYAVGTESPGGVPFYNHLSVADLNADGLDDILVVRYGEQPLLYMSTGTAGSFVVQHLSTSDTACLGGRIADVDGDGILDILVGCSQLAVLYGHRDGTYLRTQNFTNPAGACLRPDVADFDGDGLIDVVVGTGSAYSVFYGQVDGTLAAESQIPGYFAISYAGPVAGDLNDDGYADILLPGGIVSATMNQKNRIFAPLLKFSATNAAAGVLVDVDHDGRLDAIVTSSNDGAVLLKNLAYRP